MIKAPSLVRDSTWIWPGDSALNAPPMDAAEDVSAEWKRKVKVAQETGQWDGLFKPGDKPTRFTVRYIPGTKWRALGDAIRDGKFGPAIADALIVRLAVRGVANLIGDGSDLELKCADVPGFGSIADETLTDTLDAYDPAIVSELATFICERQAAPSPK